MIPVIKNENDLRKLAGIPIKEDPIDIPPDDDDEAEDWGIPDNLRPSKQPENEGLDNIIAKHREAFESVMQGQSDLYYDHQELYEELYEYFFDQMSMEAPGTVNADTGDPDQWIMNELDILYGDDFKTYDESMDGDFDSGMASAGMGTDEDYGGYNESKEPKTFKEHLQAVQEGSLRKDINTLSNHQQRQIDLKKNVQAHDEMTTKLGMDPLKSTQALMHAKKHGIEPSAMVQGSPQYKMRGRSYGVKPGAYDHLKATPAGNIARAKMKARKDA